MNTIKNLKWMLFCCSLLVGKLVNAQTEYKPGYIINSVGDTITGELGYRDMLQMRSACRFRQDSSTFTEFTPYDIQAFRFEESKFFVSKEINDERLFLECLVGGKVNIYYQTDQQGEHYYIEKEGLALAEIPYHDGIRYVDDKKVSHQSTIHIGLLKYFMQDAPELHYQIESIEKPDHNSLIRLATDYHKSINKEDDLVIYEKFNSSFKIFPELIGGVIQYKNLYGLVDQPYGQFGVIGHIRLSGKSEKFYFRTGILVSKLEFQQENSPYYKSTTTFYRIPLQVEYIYPVGQIRPRLAYGWNFYSQGYSSVSVDFGLNLMVSESAFFTVTTDVEFDQSALIIPSSLLSYSFKLGFLFNVK